MARILIIPYTGNIHNWEIPDSQVEDLRRWWHTPPGKPTDEFVTVAGTKVFHSQIQDIAQAL